ncbi:YolD-like family protein [Bacillus solimangrovi]|nr:YolD-like family protein [Bacillus solimangrovi]
MEGVGSFKYNTIELPTHIAPLKDILRKKRTTSKPNLDEQEMQEIIDTIQQAIHKQAFVHLTYFENNQYRLLIGKINELSLSSRTLTVNDAFSVRTTLSLANIIYVTFA